MKNTKVPTVAAETLITVFNQLPGKPGGRFDNDLSVRQREQRKWLGRPVNVHAWRIRNELGINEEGNQ